jgi:hypothetical protein
MSIEREFDDWYQSDEFKNVISQATVSSYHAAHSDFLVWEKETKELVKRIHSAKSKEVSKLEVWKKVSKEFGFAQKWEHRLSDHLSIMYPTIFTMGLDDNSEPDIVNLVSAPHGIEFKTCTNTIGWNKKAYSNDYQWMAQSGAPTWSKKGMNGTKEWFKYTISAWRNCPFVYSHDKVALANPREVIFSTITEDMLDFKLRRAAGLSKKQLLENDGSIVYSADKASYPKWYR